MPPENIDRAYLIDAIIRCLIRTTDADVPYRKLATAVVEWIETDPDARDALASLVTQRPPR